jgi:hypothetical protein
MVLFFVVPHHNTEQHEDAQKYKQKIHNIEATKPHTKRKKHRDNMLPDQTSLVKQHVHPHLQYNEIKKIKHNLKDIS